MTELTVRRQDLASGAASCTVTRPVPLDTLIAFLFEGRECDQVRAMLARGWATAHGARLSWLPLELSVERFTEIERSFPQASPTRVLDPRDVSEAALTDPEGASLWGLGALSLRPPHPAVQDAAAAARYLWFDYGPWADVYVAEITATTATELLQRGAAPEWNGQSPSAWFPDQDAYAVRFVAPRPGVTPPWTGFLDGGLG